MEETNNISNINSEEGAKGIPNTEKYIKNLVAQLKDLKKKVKEDIERLAITYIFGTLMPDPSTKHLDTTIAKVNKSTVASNALLDCYNSLKGLTLESKVFILEILINKLFNTVEAEILTSLIQLDNHCKMIELIETKSIESNKPSEEEFSERMENVKKFRKLINTILQLRFNEEER